jgi:quercetin dioxygenase-like cupin family protein
MMNDEMQVVKRETIPPITSVEHDGQVHVLGELRDFRWSERLREFMPDPEQLSVSWVVLQCGETLEAHVHPIQSMMVVYQGSGEMLGDLERAISQGDVIVVPAGQRHGFTGGASGLYALSIQFGASLYTTPERPRVVFADDGSTESGAEPPR